MTSSSATTAASSPSRSRMAGLAAVVVLAPAALVPTAAPIVLLGAGALVVMARPRSPASWAAAAVIPVATSLTWGTSVDTWLTDRVLVCADPASPLALSRVLEAAIVISLVALLARRLGSGPAELGLRRPGRTQVLLALLALATVPLASLAIGPVLAEPFFGPMALQLAPAAVLPALMLAVANGSMEELVYRGALLRWDARLAGTALALIGQALIFGLAHVGPDFTGSPLPVVLAVAAGGLVAGMVACRTGSLFLPIVVHVCFDVPLYFALACRGG